MTDEPFSLEIVRFLQNKLINILNSKDIAIEVMPTSNLRISLYEKYNMHHVYRWLFEFNEKPKLVICSDDPGIFSTTLKNEFQVILRNIPIDQHSDLIESLLKTAEIYKF